MKLIQIVRALDGCGLSPRQVLTLILSIEGKTGMLEMSRLVGVLPASMTGMAKTLEDRGLLERRTQMRDSSRGGPGVYVVPVTTGPGREVLKKLSEKIKAKDYE